MKHGYLSEYFAGIAAKRLSAVEADISRSNQHEFNGVEKLKAILGEPSGKEHYPAKFIYLSDRDSESIVEDLSLTWYDSRQKAREERKVMRWEYRLYFPANAVSLRAKESDLLIIAMRHDRTLLAVVAENGSTIERQILWLFGFTDLELGFSVKSEGDIEQDRVGYAARIILEQIGVEPEEQAPDYLEEMLSCFGGRFPKSIEFSAYARSTVHGVTTHDDADLALVTWMEREELLFRTLERYLLGLQLQKLKEKQEIDTDAFMKLAMSFMQRRKSRAGSALENHLEQVFSDSGVTYTRTGVTENNLKPDFIFPNIQCYRDFEFPDSHLTMLAAKTTCKDRWRQILNEAERIPSKHLITLEPSISEGQTNEMKIEKVQLIVPRPLHCTFTSSQQRWLLGVADFVSYVRTRQSGKK